jgi:tetratricopeptide (TPR) repeat protein/CHASE2 domain-containing sensor protein
LPKRKSEAVTSDPDNNPTPRSRRFLAAFLYVLAGVLITLILMGVKHLFEHSTRGRDAQLWTFAALQSVLSSIDANNPVVLLDISDLPGGKPNDPTPRSTLKDIIGALAAQGPRAIAVDIDFSPYAEDFVSPEDDPDFFDFCLDVRNKRRVPVFLAVGRRRTAPSEAWLGDEKYEALAVAVPVDGDDTSKLPLWVKVKESSKPLNTMSYALALEYRKQLPEPPPWIASAVENQADPTLAAASSDGANSDVSGPVYATRLVNYSKLDLLKSSAQKDTSAEAVKASGSLYQNKLVILGDVSRPSDPFPVPGRQPDEAGALLEACATYTLVREPLFEFTSKVRTYLDLLISISIILSVAIIRYRNPHNYNWKGKQAVFIYLAILVVVMAGFLLVRLANVMWLDFILVVGALLLHPYLEHLLHWLVRRFKERRRIRQPAKLSLLTAVVCSAALLVCFERMPVYAQDVGSLCQKRVAVVVVQIRTTKKGYCYYKENKDADANKLTPNDAGRKQFRAGQRLSCDKDCQLVVYICGTKTEHPVQEHLPKWYRVLHGFRPEENDKFKKDADRTTKFVPMDPRPIWPGLATFLGSGSVRVYGIAHTGPPREINAIPMRDNNPALEAKLTRMFEEAKAFRAAGDYSEAEATLLKARELERTDRRASWALGNLYAEQLKWKQAVAAYRDASFIVDPALNLAFAFAVINSATDVKGEDLREAEWDLWLAARLEPRNMQVYVLLYQLLEKRHANPAEMEEAYRRAFKLNSHSFETCFRYSQFLLAGGRTGDGEKYLQRAEKAASTATEFFQVGAAWDRQRKYERAEQSLEQSVKLEPNNPDALLTLGRLQLIQRHEALAIQSLQRAVQLQPNEFAPHFLFATAQLRTGKLARAEETIKALEPTVKEGSDESLALGSAFAALGDAYLSAGQITEAIRVYERALNYDPEDEEVKEKLADARKIQP